MSEIYTVIMAGGSGTRFWPSSRRLKPKQFLPLGDGVTPLLTATVKRVAPLSPPERVLIVTRADLAEVTHEACPEVPPANILLEPVGRNTAPCVAWATAVIQRRDPNAVVVVLAADAHISDEPAFLAALRLAAEAAGTGAIVTLGITPTRPETGYGYLHVGEGFEGAPEGVRVVRAFVEKPDAERAQQYLLGGEHLWNAGIFVFRADVMARAVRAHLPTVADATAAFDQAAGLGVVEEVREVNARYPGLPNVSLDYGVMENERAIAVVPVSCGWSDVGSWQAAWELGLKDGAGNVLAGVEGTVVDARGNVVVAPPGKVVALVGVSDLVVVDTGDVLLVMSRERAQDVKKAVDALSEARRHDVL
ncbi:MAG: sugar phosphate nucleotidyltransferase [Deltaproteobacteria bacterium]|nr:sugar phosphate nucleotidyltransferase [Myxococcales bacterium]MDP3215814.1 sugar phosphate nucleotidyltransferase [Deltaproteobacteria bacterium]